MLFTPLPCTRPYLLSAAALLLALTSGAGCTEDNAAAAECGDHGELHGDHCHCDPGFSLSDDELSCVADQDTDDDDAGQPDDLAFAPTSIRAATGTAADGTRVWLLEASGGDALLNVELYENFGGPTSPAVVEIAAAETDYATCGTCLILQTGCAAHGDHFHCDRTFMPRAEGEAHIDAIGTSAGEQLAGELLGLVFQEVSIADNFQTQPVSGGQVLHLDAWAFDVQLQALGGSEEECGGHGQMHGDHCHCDTGYGVDPEDPTRCIPE